MRVLRMQGKLGENDMIQARAGGTLYVFRIVDVGTPKTS